VNASPTLAPTKAPTATTSDTNARADISRKARLQRPVARRAMT
jgi:hypothetical protein